MEVARELDVVVAKGWDVRGLGAVVWLVWAEKRDGRFVLMFMFGFKVFGIPVWERWP